MSGKKKLENVQHYNYLGVTLDNRLILEDVLKEKNNKVKSRLYQLGRIRNSRMVYVK